MEFREYTKEDFLTSPEPFEVVYRHRDNGFEFTQAIEQMACVAQSVGVRNFKTLFKEYCKAMGVRGRGNTIKNATNFSGQPIELDCGNWIADDDGIRVETEMGEMLACIHPILPTKRLVNIDNNTEKLKIEYKKGNFWRSLVESKRTLASASQILDLAERGVAVNSENARLLVRYLHDAENLNYERIEEVSSIGRLGWVKGYGFSPYVEHLEFDGDVSCKNFFDSVKQVGDFTQWLEMALDVRKNSLYGRLLIAASLSSVLVQPLNCLPFFVHFWGGTEAGKTVGLMLAASVWADPRPGRYIQTFNSTAVGKERSAAFVYNMPLIMDELQIASSRESFDQEIYKLSEGVGKTRGNKAGGVDETPTWCNCILTNGEMPITGVSSGSGAVNRIIEVECTTALFSDPKHVADTCLQNFGFAGRYFVEWLERNDPSFTTAAQLYKIYSKELEQMDTTGKQSMAMALILAADFLAEQAIFHDGLALKPQDVKPFLKSKKDVSVNERAYEYIRETLAANKKKFDDDDDIMECWGMVDDTYFYVIKSRFEKICVEAGYSAKSLLSWMKQTGKIEVSKGYTKTKRINGEAVHCIWVIKDPDEQLQLEDVPDSEECPF